MKLIDVSKNDIKELIGKPVYLKNIDCTHNNGWKVIGRILEDMRNPAWKYIHFTDNTIYPLSELNNSFFLYQYYNETE